jgi:hypothetical protein
MERVRPGELGALPHPAAQQQERAGGEDAQRSEEDSNVP